MRGDGKWSSKGTQLRLLRGRWRNAGIPRRRLSPTCGIRMMAGVARRCGAEGQTFHWQTYTVNRPTMNGDWHGLARRLPVWLVAYYAEVSVPPFYLRSALTPDGRQ